MPRRLSIFGATGSVGQSTLDLLRPNPESWDIVALTAHRNVTALAAAAKEFRPRLVVIADPRGYQPLKEALAGGDNADIEVAAGTEALVAAAQLDCTLMVAAIVGYAGLAPTMTALECGTNIALANKEALVAAGALMMRAAHKSGAKILPIDSEHNAIFQCLAGAQINQLRRIILTASGGPFRTMGSADRESITVAQACAHPTWAMGTKISIDSATMMNKGFELIEAYHLFPVGLDNIDIVIHPQSTVHSLVEFIDHSMLAQMGAPDMRIPIAYALAWPERMATACAALDLVALGRLDFFAVDEEYFPAPTLCRAALAENSGRPAQINAINEVAVEAFLAGRLSFPAIMDLVSTMVDIAPSPPPPQSLADVTEIDRAARADTQQRLVQKT